MRVTSYAPPSRAKENNPSQPFPGRVGRSAPQPAALGSPKLRSGTYVPRNAISGPTPAVSRCDTLGPSGVVMAPRALFGSLRSKGRISLDRAGVQVPTVCPFLCEVGGRGSNTELAKRLVGGEIGLLPSSRLSLQAAFFPARLVSSQGKGAEAAVPLSHVPLLRNVTPATPWYVSRSIAAGRLLRYVLPATSHVKWPFLLAIAALNGSDGSWCVVAAAMLTAPPPATMQRRGPTELLPSLPVQAKGRKVSGAPPVCWCSRVCRFAVGDGTAASSPAHLHACRGIGHGVAQGITQGTVARGVTKQVCCVRHRCTKRQYDRRLVFFFSL